MLVTYTENTISLSSFSNIAELLRVLMAVKKLSISDIIKQSELSTLTVQNILKGSQRITKYTSEKLSKVFLFKPLYLYKKQLEENIKALEKEIKQLNI